MAHSIFINRSEAEASMSAINVARHALVTQIQTLQNMRKPPIDWQDKVSAFRLALESLESLQERIGTAHNLGGW